jgi:hypothetical protein
MGHKTTSDVDRPTHGGVNQIAGLFEWRAKINDAQTILDFRRPNGGETIGLAGPVGMAQCRLIDKLMDLPLSLKKIAGRQWLCYCSAAAVANKIAGRRWLCYCLAAAVANKGNWLAMTLLLLGGCCCKRGQQQKNGSMFPHCCRSFKFKLPIQTDLPSS